MEAFKNIIIALDFKTDEEKAKIDHALVIAQEHETTMFTLFTVVPRVISDPEKMITPADKQQEQLVKRAYENLGKVAAYFLEDDFSKIKITCIVEIGDHISNPAFKVFPVILEGNPTVELLNYVEQESIDLLVMGMLSRTGLRGFFIGNTPEKIMDDIDCSILVVKPKGFVSQINI